MLEKIKVSKEVASALELAKGKLDNNEIIAINAKFGFANDCSALNSLLPIEIAHALLIGYEVELTLEEKIQKIEDEYRYAGKDPYYIGSSDAASEIILDVINLLHNEGVIK